MYFDQLCWLKFKHGHFYFVGAFCLHLLIKFFYIGAGVCSGTMGLKKKQENKKMSFIIIINHFIVIQSYKLINYLFRFFDFIYWWWTVLKNCCKDAFRNSELKLFIRKIKHG